MSKHSNRMPVTTTTSRERIAAAHTATDATVTEEKAPKAKKERLSQKDRFAATLTRIGQQATKLASKLDAATNPEKVIVLAGVSDAAHAASARFSQLPADWSPRAVKPRGIPSIIVGSVVSVRDKKREQAAAILDEGELVGLTVVKIADKIVRLVTPSGATVAAPKAWFRSDKKA